MMITVRLLRDDGAVVLPGDVEGWARAADELRHLGRGEMRELPPAPEPTRLVAAEDDRVGGLGAGLGLAAGDDNVRALIGHRLGNGSADAARGAGDDRDLAGEVEQRHASLPISFVLSEVEGRPLGLCATAPRLRSGRTG